ncbi:ABC-type Zn uptake system ZnuABC Zn-binding protein ZnuA [Bradyrhizobium sp. LM6.9]
MRFLLLFALLLIASPLHAAERLNVVASFSILGDFVRNVGGDRINLTTLVGADSDVHVYTPAPSDAKRIADAKLVIVNGLGLEGWLPRLVQSSGAKAEVVTASAGIAPLKLGSAADPHGWQSVPNAKRSTSPALPMRWLRPTPMTGNSSAPRQRPIWKSSECSTARSARPWQKSRRSGAR